MGTAVLAIVCCAALPLLAAVAGGIAVTTILGLGAGLIAAVGLVAFVVARRRRRGP